MNETPNTKLMELRATIDSKTKLADMANQMIQSVINGDVDAKEAAVALDAMGKIIKTAIDKIDDLVLSELDKYGKLEKIFIGRIEIQKREAASKYDFSGCGDPVHAKLLAAKTEADAALKEREAFLKALPKPITAVDDETGEICRIIPATKTSTSTYAIIYPKD